MTDSIMKPIKNKMKTIPFDLERYYKEQRKICTRDGKEVRIICTDLKNDTYKIAAAIKYSKGEFVRIYTESGFIEENEHESDDDLVMPIITHTGWINIYATSLIEGCRVSSNKIYPTMKEALESKKKNWKSTIKIEWEE